MLLNGVRYGVTSASYRQDSYRREIEANHVLLNARAERNATLLALRAKKEMFEQEVAELAGCEKLTRAQQAHMQSLKKRIALLSQTLSKVR